MTLSRKEQWLMFWLLNGALLFVIFFFPIYDKFIRDLPISKCYMLKLLQIYCPACGGTRAFEALCRLNILESFKLNPIVPIGAVGLIIYEYVIIKHLIKKTERKVFFNTWIAITFIVLWFGYAIVRNILLFNGIDILGDVII